MSYSSQSHGLQLPGSSVITISQSLLKFVFTESATLCNHLIFCHPLLLLLLVLPSIRVFSNESTLCFRRPEYWSFSNSLSNEYSFRFDWFDLVIQGLSRVFSITTFLLCDNLERWDGVGSGKEIHEGGEKCISMADSCRCMAETNTTL